MAIFSQTTYPLNGRSASYAVLRWAQQVCRTVEPGPLGGVFQMPPGHQSDKVAQLLHNSSYVPPPSHGNPLPAARAVLGLWSDDPHACVGGSASHYCDTSPALTLMTRFFSTPYDGTSDAYRRSVELRAAVFVEGAFLFWSFGGDLTFLQDAQGRRIVPPSDFYVPDHQAATRALSRAEARGYHRIRYLPPLLREWILKGTVSSELSRIVDEKLAAKKWSEAETVARLLCQLRDYDQTSLLQLVRVLAEQEAQRARWSEASDLLRRLIRIPQGRPLTKRGRIFQGQAFQVLRKLEERREIPPAAG